MSLVLKWQDYRKFYVYCILENSRYSEYSSGSQYTNNLRGQESKYARVSQDILNGFLINLRF